MESQVEWPGLSCGKFSYNHLKIKPIQFSKREAGSEMALPCRNTSFLKAIIDGFTKRRRF